MSSNSPLRCLSAALLVAGLVAGLVACLLACSEQPDTTAAPALGGAPLSGGNPFAGDNFLAGGAWHDLTHAFGPDTLAWPTSDAFELEVLSAEVTPRGFYYAANRFCTAEHVGTHIDAPVHFAEGRAAVDAIPLERLMGPGCVIDVRAACAADRNHEVSVDELRAWEAQHGRLPDGAIVLLRTGFAQAWGDAAAYLGTTLRGPEGVDALSFPGLHPDAARWLVAERDIAALGLDTASIDHGPSFLYESHVTLFEADIPAFENVADLGAMPATGSFVIALPMKIAGGSGAPLRIVAWVPGD